MGSPGEPWHIAGELTQKHVLQLWLTPKNEGAKVFFIVGHGSSIFSVLK